MNESTTAFDLGHLRQWIGRIEERRDVVAAAPLAGWSATLDRDDPAPEAGTPIAPLAHWLYFLPQAPQHEIGADGHPVRGGFLPPVPLPRRMWAGGRLQFDHDLHVGDPVVRRSTIRKVDAKLGRTGNLVFVTVRHEIRNATDVAVREEHDIVYRDHPRPGAPPVVPASAPDDEEFGRVIDPDPVLLFRYSALTFNGHRIHYDRPYAVGTEGYPGLVVHGPLVATLLVDLVGREFPGARVRTFDFQAASPLFDTQPFTICGRRDVDGGVALWARDHAGHLAMRARATLL